MRVLIIRPDYMSRSSGTSERIFQIVNSLANLGANVFYSTMTKSKMNGVDFHKNVQIIRIPMIFDFFGVLGWINRLLTTALISGKYEIVQVESFSFARTLIYYLLLRPFSKKFVIVFHDKCWEQDPRREFFDRIQLLLQRFLLSIFDASIVPGPGLKRWFEKLHGKWLCRKMIVIPNGVPQLRIGEDFDNSTIRTKYGINPKAFVVLFFGSMDFGPNYNAALYLFKLSGLLSQKFRKDTGTNFVFVVAGKNSEVLPKTRQFLPIGFVEELKELLALPDVIVMPHVSCYSGPHVKTMYSFISKKPVVATKDSVKEMVGLSEGKHFLLFDVNEPLTLLNALKTLYYSNDLRETISTNAYLYSTRFSWQNVASLHLKLYRELIGVRK